MATKKTSKTLQIPRDTVDSTIGEFKSHDTAANISGQKAQKASFPSGIRFLKKNKKKTAKKSPCITARDL